MLSCIRIDKYVCASTSRKGTKGSEWHSIRFFYTDPLNPTDLIKLLQSTKTGRSAG